MHGCLLLRRTQVRALLQKKLCRAIPLETIGALTVAGLRALAEEAGQGERPCLCRQICDVSAWLRNVLMSCGHAHVHPELHDQWIHGPHEQQEAPGVCRHVGGRPCV